MTHLPTHLPATCGHLKHEAPRSAVNTSHQNDSSGWLYSVSCGRTVRLQLYRYNLLNSGLSWQQRTEPLACLLFIEYFGSAVKGTFYGV